MSLEHLSKFKLDKESLSEIRGSGEGTVVCADGTSFSASASSMEVVRDRGDFWCRHHGHGAGVTFVFVGEGEMSFPE